MSAPLVPSPLDYIGHRRFAFYPAIQGVAPNEWVLGTGSWSEVQVINAHTGGEIWIPRQYIGAVSESQSFLLVVGLTQELAYRGGAIEPRVKRVIEMPHQPETPGERRHEGPAPVIGIRIESRYDSPMNRALITVGVGALIVSLIAAALALFNSCAPSYAKRGDRSQPAHRRLSSVAVTLEPAASSIKSRMVWAAASC